VVVLTEEGDGGGVFVRFWRFPGRSGDGGEKMGTMEDDEATGIHRGGESYADEWQGEKALSSPFLPLQREKKE
jgi:hypothetical protein